MTSSERRKWPRPRPHNQAVIRVAEVRPARAATVYTLFALVLVAYILGGIAFLILLHRTQQVCEPLRAGQQLGSEATTAAGRGYADTFGEAADQLGCRR